MNVKDLVKQNFSSVSESQWDLCFKTFRGTRRRIGYCRFCSVGVNYHKWGENGYMYDHVWEGTLNRYEWPYHCHKKNIRCTKGNCPARKRQRVR